MEALGVLKAREVREENMTNQDLAAQLGVPLLLIRMGVAIVFFMWTLDKLLNPEHAARVFAAFYMIPSLTETASYIIGSLQMIVVLAFLAGAFKRFSYTAVFVMHLVSSASTYARYFDPWTGTNLLFFAALPMLAGCWALVVLREHDRILSVDAWRDKRG